MLFLVREMYDPTVQGEAWWKEVDVQSSSTPIHAWCFSQVSPRPSKGGEKNFLLGVITGLSASMIILLVIIGLLVYRCYYAKNTRAGTANATGNSTQDTVMGNPQTNSDFERDYESVNNSISSEPWELQTYVRMEGVPQHPPVNDAPESDQKYMTMHGGQGIRGFGHIYENSRGVL